jgi:hypothetical protein
VILGGAWPIRGRSGTILGTGGVSLGICGVSLGICGVSLGSVGMIIGDRLVGFQLCQRLRNSRGRRYLLIRFRLRAVETIHFFQMQSRRITH